MVHRWGRRRGGGSWWDLHGVCVGDPGTAGVGIGVFKSTDGGDTWKAYTEGLPGGDAEAVGFDPTNPDVVYAGSLSQEPIMWKSVDGGRHWVPYRMGVPGFQDFTTIVVDPERPSTVYAATLGVGGVLKSTNAGRTWRISNTGLEGTGKDLAMDPSDPSHLVVAGAGVYESTDGAQIWHPLTDPAAVSAVAIDPTDPNTIYAGSFGQPFQGGVVYKTTNGGGTWQPIYRLRADRDVSDIEVDPSDPDTVYVAIKSFADVGIVVKSTDGGRTWVELKVGTDASNINDLAIVTVDPSSIWAGCSDGVFFSTDGGLHWTWRSDGLRSREVGDIVVDSTGSLVYAANGAGGIARLEVP